MNALDHLLMLAALLTALGHGGLTLFLWRRHRPYRPWDTYHLLTTLAFAWLTLVELFVQDGRLVRAGGFRLLMLAAILQLWVRVWRG